VVEQQVNLTTGTEMVHETLVYLSFNHLMHPLACKSFFEPINDHYQHVFMA
jgi:hypothetical protein